MQSFFTLSLLFLLFFCIGASGFGSMGPISAAFGDNGFFCAIDASGKQDVICWIKNTTLFSSSPSSTAPPTSSAYFGDIPAMAALSGGEGFLCGILANSSHAFCWSSHDSDLVPSVYRDTAYTHIAAGKDHACAIRGSYYSDLNSGTIDCWEIVKGANNSLVSTGRSNFYDRSISNLVFSMLVSGDGFSCGRLREGGLVCFGPNSMILSGSIESESEKYRALASSIDSLCGVLEESGEVKCWGSTDESIFNPPAGTQFVSLTAGANHYCGIRKDNHGVECWGSFNLSSVPKGVSGFMAIAASDFTTCGIRENDLVIDCWFANGTSPPEFDPPLELCSPALCGSGLCGDSEFTFNASMLNEPDLTSLCVRRELKICSPCGLTCSQGFFLSSPCTANADRVCTDCSLCESSSCRDVCGIQSFTKKTQWTHLTRLHLLIIVVPSLSILILVAIYCYMRPCLIAPRKEEGSKKQFKSCIGKSEIETDDAAESYLPSSVASCPGVAQAFRLLELKDATNGFKEFNELGRGSYGFVYKAVLADCRQVAVKRANAATIIHSNRRDFEMELEVLCNARHCNIVNLLGYCTEMGERLLVYEYMPHGTLHDHLHSGLSPLNWNLRLRISMQAAKGLAYLHNEAEPPIIHRNVKTSNILLDAEWGARIADFGLITPNEDLSGDMKTDVYNFGIVLLEILTGRKAYDMDYTPPSIVEWAVPLIKQGKGAVIIDQDVVLPKNVEPLLKFSDIAERAVKENPNDRPTMSDLATWLEQIVKDML